MTTSASRPASAASAASRWPGRKSSKPKRSRSASRIERATLPRPAAARTGPCPLVAKSELDLRERERLERELARGLLGPGQHVLTGEAGVAVRRAVGANRLVDPVEREVGQRVAAELLGDLRLRALVRDHLLARGHVHAVEAG